MKVRWGQKVCRLSLDRHLSFGIIRVTHSRALLGCTASPGSGCVRDPLGGSNHPAAGDGGVGSARTATVACIQAMCATDIQERSEGLTRDRYPNVSFIANRGLCQISATGKSLRGCGFRARYKVLRVAGKFGARSHEGAALWCGRRMRSCPAAQLPRCPPLRACALRGASLLRVPDTLPVRL